MARYIFVTGGVVSSLGKGLSSASLAYLLKSQGYKVRIRKMDPYLNVDPGTMSPFQHGEVFVTNDGAETDLDLGHYERFTNISEKKSDKITTGTIWSIVTNWGCSRATLWWKMYIRRESLDIYICTSRRKVRRIPCRLWGLIMNESITSQLSDNAIYQILEIIASEIDDIDDKELSITLED